MDLDEIGVVPIFRTHRRRNGGYFHKNQMQYYSLVGEEDKHSPQFRSRYRFTETTIKSLAALYGEQLVLLKKTNNTFTVEQKLCIALRYYATGTQQTEVGDGEGASQAPVSRIVNQVTRIFSKACDNVVKFSLDDSILETVSSGFYGFKGRMPLVVGALDCTHVPILAPSEFPEQYVNREGYHSLNCQMVCNHRGAITQLSCRWPGSANDYRILKESALWSVIEDSFLGEKFILGDSGYKCHENLLTPYPVDDTDEKEYFNLCQSQTRGKIECVFGQMKRKFPCLTKVPEYDVTTMVHIIRACVFLWNWGLICGDNKGYNPDEFIIEDKEELQQNLGATITGDLRRDTICRYLWRNK